MRIDIIVPNFDESSDEVTLSAWYKKVGEKVAKGEVIADAETSTIACGITSSYDCILAKLLVQEGETISQGTKIAVIETDLSANISDIKEEEVRENAEKESETIDKQIKQESEEEGARIRQQMEEVRQNTLKTLESDEKSLLKNEERRADNRKHLRESLDLDNDNNESPYTLSVPLDTENSIKEHSEKIISGSNRDSDEKALIEEVVENSEKLEEKTIDNFSDQAEQTFKNIIKDTENQAKAEAEKLKKNILSEAQKTAHIQADALKAKILKECEDKAVKDANEMHQRIIQGSVSEAEATKSKLLDDAKTKAEKEAEELRASILKKAQKTAEDMAEAIKKEHLEKAKREAEERAEVISKEIMEKAISDSKSDAKAVKKDILHSAHKHIAKEAENLVRVARKETQVMAEIRVKELMSIVMMFAEKEAENMKNEVFRNKEHLTEVTRSTENELAQLKEELVRTGRHAKGILASVIHVAENEIQDVKNGVLKAKDQVQNIINDALQLAGNKAQQLEVTILQETKQIAEKRANEMLSTALARIQQNVNNIEEQIIDQTKAITDEQVKMNQAKEETALMREELIRNKNKMTEVSNIIEKAVENLTGELSQSTQKAKDLMSSVVSFSETQVQEIRKNVALSENQILDILNKEIIRNRNKMIEAAKTTEEEISKLKEELEQSELRAKGLLKSAISFAETEVRGIKNSVSQSGNQVQEIINDVIRVASNKAGQLESTILNEAKREAEERAEELLEVTMVSLQKEIDNMKMHVLERTKEIAIDQAKEVIGETNKVVIDNICQMKEAMLKSTKHTVQNSVSDVIESVKEDVRSALEQLKQESPCECGGDILAKAEPKVEKNCEQDRIIRKLMNITEEEGGTPDMYPNNWNKPSFLETPTDENEEIDVVRRRLSERRNDAYDASVISTVSNEVDMSAVISLEENFGKQFTEKYNTRLGFTPFFIKAAIDALKKYKIFNAHVHENQILYKENFDISIITYGNDGVSAPVIRQADKMSIAEIEKAMITLSKRALNGTLSVEEVSGGTFTVVNAGIYGSIMGTDLLTPPQVATLSVHKMKNKPVAVDKGVEVRPILYISLSYDHRVSDTKQASEFLSHVKQFVENPGWQLLGLAE